MNDSHARESGRLAPGPDAPPVAVLAATLRRSGGSELACCCSLALLAREVCGGRPCRVECSPDRPGPAGGGSGPDRAASADDGPGWHRIPVRSPISPGASEAWLAVELHEGERAAPGVDRLTPLATLAGLALERHRLAREARRARRDAKEVRELLGHALRGHLHAALLRADNLLLGLRGDGDPDVAEIREQLERLKDTVEDMVEEIRDVVDAPDAAGARSPEPAAGPGEDLRIPELLREAGETGGGGEDPPRVEVEGEVPALRGDARQLGPALGELIDLARRSRSTPTVTVRPEGPSGARIDVSVELLPLSGPGGGPADPEAVAGAPPADARPGGPDGEGAEVDGLSLRDVVARAGGRLRIEADHRSRATVVVILPGGDGD